MMAAPAIGLGIELRVLVRDPQDSAAQVVPGSTVGAEDDLDTLRAFAAGCDVITFDHEHVPTAHLAALEAEGVAVRPGSDALVHAQDKVAMRERLTGIGIPCPAWALVSSVAELASFGAATGWPLIVKTPRGGYDGRGVRVVATAQEAADWLVHGPLLAEAKVAFTRELAVQVARS